MSDRAAIGDTTALRAELTRIRAFAARSQQIAENLEYPQRKSELRTNLQIAVNALNKIANWQE